MLIITSPMDQGGAETFLMKVYRALDKTKYQFDFYVMGNRGFYDDEIIGLGGKITYGPMKSEGFFAYRKSLKNFLKNNMYDYVYRAMANSLASLDLFYAKKYGKAKTLVARSMIAEPSRDFIQCLFMPLLRSVSTVKVAPSTEAGLFMFGKRSVRKNNVNILMNGIDTSLFVFDNKTRIEKRSELTLDKNEILFIHIGRFSKQKNQLELADIFKKIVSLKENARLLCIGSGDEKEDFIKKCEKLNILHKIIFLEQRKDINELLMAADLMLLPSLFEGLPNVIMEAQATGLPCLVSDTVTKECNVTNLVFFDKLGNSKKWAEESLNILDNNLNLREENAKKFPVKYDINQIVEQFVQIVFNDKK